MSVAASRELNELPWRVDTDCLPASSHSPDAVICFDSDLVGSRVLQSIVVLFRVVHGFPQELIYLFVA